MSELGHCSDPLCTDKPVRLFDCAHHCMKLVCLQHLIEHDRLIDHNQEYFDELRLELKQLWTTYSTFIDETKLRLEFEQKIKKHRQLIQEITNLCGSDSNNMDQYRLIIDKLRQNIEQEKLFNQDCLELVSNIDQIKSEPMDDIETLDSLDLDMTIQSPKSNSDNRSQKSTKDTSTHHDHTSRNERTRNSSNESRLMTTQFPGHCPFSIDGAFGLTETFHGTYLCRKGKYYQNISDHLFRFHQFNLKTVEKIRHALGNNEDPSKIKLFQSNDMVVDRITHNPCPFSSYHTSSYKTTYPLIPHCRSKKPQGKYALRVHLTTFHRMKTSDAEKLICTLETTAKRLAK